MRFRASPEFEPLHISLLSCVVNTAAHWLALNPDYSICSTLFLNSRFSSLMRVPVLILGDMQQCLSLMYLLLSLDIPTEAQHSMDMLLGPISLSDTLDLMEMSEATSVPTIPSVVVPMPTMVSTLAPNIVPPLGSFFDLDLDGLMEGA